jgi:hypothetical protein
LPAKRPTIAKSEPMIAIPDDASHARNTGI